MDNTNQAAALSTVGHKEPSYAELKQRLAELESKVAVKQAKALRFKVSEKGGVSVYGLNTQWPVTLYREQWDRLFERIPDLKAFIAANRSSLKEKGE